MNPARLPTTACPTRYDLRLEPDLPSRRFAGEETITLTVQDATPELVLHAAELEIQRVVIARDGGPAQEAAVTLDEQAERCHLRFATPLGPGEWRLHLVFRGLLNDKLRGFYRSTYQDETGATQTLAATQFEATDARRAFPCWDEPAFKAVFATTLVVDPALAVVSNTGVERERLEGGKRVVEFHETIRMSTYLVAFVVGPLEATDPILVGPTPVRIWAVPGKRHLTRFAQQAAAFSLQFFRDYYEVPYPGDKLDLLAIPDFASGAMENLGAITFRETALLIDEGSATHAELERVADVVAHENAHMWFGDLVTMTWWNGLWLNEAFATFMEMLAVDAWKPEWKRWATFGTSRAAALVVDGLHSTRPIEYPVQAPQDADAMFDVLTYEKGASVLRMLEQHLGPRVFRDGVREYLRAHAYGNADTADLWKALGRVAREPVPALLQQWIFGEGYPLIDVELVGPTTLRMSQQRFTYLSRSSAALEGAEPTWHTPIQLRVAAGGRTDTRRVLLAEREMTVPVPEGFEHVLLNEGGHGFYRGRYAPELTRRLLALLPHGLPAIERFNLVNDAWALTLAGLSPLTEYLELTGHLREERDRTVWAVLLDSFHALHRIVPSAERAQLERLIRDRVRPAVERLGWTPSAGEDDLTRQLRGDLLRALGTVGNDPDIQAQARVMYDRAGDHPAEVDPNLLPALVTILAFTGDAARYDEFRERFRSAGTPQEQRRFLFSLAAFRPQPLVERTLDSTLNGDIRTQDGPFVIAALLQNLDARARAWRFVTHHWDTLDRLFPKQGLRRMCGGVVALATPELEREVRDFFESRKIDLGGRTLAQYLEQLHIGVKFGERASGELVSCLHAFAAP